MSLSDAITFARKQIWDKFALDDVVVRRATANDELSPEQQQAWDAYQRLARLHTALEN